MLRPETSLRPFDIEALRAEFPALSQEVNGKPLVYLDSAASTLKPQAVIDAISHYYAYDHSNVHRGAHALADRATAAFEDARDSVARFLSGPGGLVRREEVIWTRGTTEAINLVSQSWGSANLGPGDEVLISEMEHHANIVPWQLACERAGATLKVIPVTDVGELDIEAFEALLSERTKLLAVTHVSNVLGTVNPVAELVRAAHGVGAMVLIDGAQAVAHIDLDLKALDADFYVFSGHKLYGPTGIGVLYGKYDLLAAMPPWQGGGEMIDRVSFKGTTFQAPPFRFEAGTPHIAGAVGLGAAIEWFNAIDQEALRAHGHAVFAELDALLRAAPGVTVTGSASERIGAVSFLLEGAHPSDVGAFLDQAGVAVRTGHHCCQPLMRRFSVSGVVRSSLGGTSTRDDIDQMMIALERAKRILV
jgi:cysteine desulfurase/selenocysteine lyase